MNSFDRRIARIKASMGEEKAELVLKNATYLNVFTNEFLQGDIAISQGFFIGIGDYEGDEEIDMTGKTIVPGFIDGHLHLESSIVSPRQYAAAVLPHGTTAIVADPHEIGNVLGETGIDYILDATKKLPLDVYIMMSSCVPATPFDESGATIDHKMIAKYLKNERVLGLAELMNFPGVIHTDHEVMKKIQVTMKEGKMIDGHAPGLTGKALNAYVTAGIGSDHECTTAEEALAKLRLGQWIMIREGTAGKNLANLLPLLDAPYYSRCLLVTDDRHPGELARDGHIDYIIRKAIRLGANPAYAYRAASYNAAMYLNLGSRGAVCPGYQADFVVLDDVQEVSVHSVYKCGKLISTEGKLEKDAAKLLNKQDHELMDKYGHKLTNSVKTGKIRLEDIALKKKAEKIIGLVDGELLTTDEGETAQIDVSRDILKLCVVERHHHTGHVGVAFVKGYGLREGAVATSIAHDSHNIIVAGTNDDDILYAIHRLHKLQGGMVVVKDGKVVEEMALPIAGLMCDMQVEEAQQRMDAVKQAAYDLGVGKGIDPFMTLSFASLAVIPKLRLTTLGVVDVDKFELLP